MTSRILRVDLRVWFSLEESWRVKELRFAAEMFQIRSSQLPREKCEWSIRTEPNVCVNNVFPNWNQPFKERSKFFPFCISLIHSWSTLSESNHSSFTCRVYFIAIFFVLNTIAFFLYCRRVYTLLTVQTLIKRRALGVHCLPMSFLWDTKRKWV